VTLVTATLFAPTLSKVAAELAAATGLEVTVQAITNTQLGEGITVAGLLMGGDVLAQLPAESLGDLIVLPRIMFDHPDGISLDDMSPRQLAEKLNRPICLADQMGDVIDALNGKSALLFQPGLMMPGAGPEVMRDGGWAVEKYL
jgi:NifB/MoaA-like Fe-S oxidoreductase